MGRRLVLDDLEKFVMLSDPQLSPDSTELSFVVTRCVEDSYVSGVWVVDCAGGNPVRFYGEGNPLNPRWSMNGQQILFTRKRKIQGGVEGTGLWLSIISGGESRMICWVKNGGINDPQWSVSGNEVYFLSGVGETGEDVRIIESIPVWFNGEGWRYHKVRQLHVVDVGSGIVTQLTKGMEDVQCYAVGSKGNKVAYAKSASKLDPNASELHVIDVETGEDERILPGYWIFTLCWSPGDEGIAFLGHDGSHGYPTHWGLHTVNPVNGDVTCLTGELDLGCSRRHYHDIRSPYACTPKPIWNGNEIYFPVSESDRFSIRKIHAENRKIDYVVDGQFSVEEFTVMNNSVAYIKVNSTMPNEIWVEDDAGRRCITGFNRYLVEKLVLSEPEHFSFVQKDDVTVEGWALKPYGWKKENVYPGILDIHGGPRSKFGDSFMFEHQFYAANGYGVVLINIRGSDGYDQQFADIRGGYGTRDYEDLMLGLETALERNKWIDRDRLGVTGLSYGGFMTNWVVTHSDLFKAAISQNGISDWTAFFGTSDIGFHFTPDQIGGAPWSNKEGYIEKSPLYLADKVRTPVLFIHSWNDYRCWVDQSIEFFTALKSLGKPTKMAMFMEGSHVFRRSAKPSIRRRRLEIMLDWFNQYLKD